MTTSGKGGQHSDTLTKGQMATFLKVCDYPVTASLSESSLTVVAGCKALDAAVLTYTLTITMVKISILLLYRRVFDTRHFGRATLTVGFACVSWLVAALLCLAFQCRTQAERYDADSLFSDECIDLKAYWVAVTGSNMALDFVVLGLPLCMIWNLGLAPSQKMALSGIFSLGALLVDLSGFVEWCWLLILLGRVCVASLMRIITIDLVQGGDLTCELESAIDASGF